MPITLAEPAISPADMTLAELRPLLLEKMVPNVPFDGWTLAAAEAAAVELGVPAERARIAFPDGAAQMVAAYIERADARMAAALAGRALDTLKVRERIALAVRTRFEQAAPERETVRRAMAILALPQHAALSARTLWHTADIIWRAAGDTATDYNHYTKRLILGGVYAATLLTWLQDESEDMSETFAFLDRRIDGIIRFETAKAKFTRSSANFPSLSRFLGRLRYPAA